MLCFSNYQADTGIFPDTKYLIKFKAGLKKSFDWIRIQILLKRIRDPKLGLKTMAFCFFDMYVISL